ncbi:MAG: sulfotransferase family protein [Solirubrobacteraceae bacterium]
MGLTVIGAGLGRTGTNSLKTALEQLLGGPCYHMYELRARPGDLPVWEDALAGGLVDWQAALAGFAATVDWPAAAFWRELRAANRDALVLLSTRESAELWWRSMEKTIVPVLAQVPEGEEGLARQRRLTAAIIRERLTPRLEDPTAAMAAYERHNGEVRSEVPAGELIEWCAGDGWEPICAGLGLEVPETPFPHQNTTAQFRSLVGLDE